MTISNNGQFTALYNRKQSGNDTLIKHSEVLDFKPNKLKSRSWVTTNQIGNVDWKYHDTPDFSVRKCKGLWLCYDKKQKQKDSDIVREQKRLYRQLKREYEREQATPNVHAVDDTITKADKLQTVTRKKTVQLLSGLACAPRYDRIYSACF